MATTMNSNGIGDSIKNKQYGAKSSTSAIEVMQQMLQERCIAEPMFAIKMANPQKVNGGSGELSLQPDTKKRVMRGR